MNNRKQRFQKYREALSKFDVFKVNTIKIENKIEKAGVRKRRHTAFEQNCQVLESPESPENEEDDNSLSLQENHFEQKYILKQKIGEGGNGAVYRCIHKTSNKQFAVKMCRMELEHLKELKKMFIFMKQLHHRSIIKYKALYFDHEKHLSYLVMEYLPYPNLLSLKKPSEATLKNIVYLLLDAIQYVHNRNICHRDIKPENILYDQETRRIKIIDFGISKRTFLRGSRRDMLTNIGTHYYLAPEFFLGGGYDERVDLWALGVTIYKAITGVTPFEAEYHSDTVKNILSGEVIFDEAIWKDYTPFTKNFVSRLLKKKQERMSVEEAKKHFWLFELSSIKIIKVKQNLSLDQAYQIKNEDLKKERHAVHREEGELDQILEEDILYRKIETMENQQFDYIDSEDQSSKVSSKSTKSHKIQKSECNPEVKR